MVTKWKIDLPGFERYRFLEDGTLVRIPYEAHGKRYSAKIKKMCPIKHRWVISINGRVEKWSKSQLRPTVILDDDPIEISKMELKDLPFD